MPEEPDVLLVCDFGVEEVMIDFGIWTEVEEVRRDRMETWRDWVDYPWVICVTARIVT